jgi:hypothetical protein
LTIAFFMQISIMLVCHGRSSGKALPSRLIREGDPVFLLED